MDDKVILRIDYSLDPETAKRVFEHLQQISGQTGKVANMPGAQRMYHIALPGTVGIAAPEGE